MTIPSFLSTVYATDEDIAVRAQGDFWALCPASQQLAAATDGYFDGGSPWTLNSLSIDFGAAGVQPGSIVLLTQPKGLFKGAGQMLAVDAASGHSLTLRRIGQASGVGQPPAPIGGLITVQFEIRTLGPQIECASYDINQQYGIDPLIAVRAPSWVYDRRQLRQAAILTVLHRQYLSETRTDQGDWKLKLAAVKVELDDAIDRINLKWGPLGQASPPVGRLSKKISR
ncbi:hypothetical protein [Singulisphaera sp. PoT]|uniref:hypothetical protein n=1 Tax=Singulisphaera sp. PoT TaxID=3411797 RepID=UPI003BF5EC8A